jgi:hypothetical protein
VPPTILHGPDLDAAAFETRVKLKLTDLKALGEAKRRLEREEYPPVPWPPAETLRVRLARQRPPMPPRIEGWLLQQMRLLLVAPAKTGKTTLITNLSRSLLDGDPWLGVAPVTPLDNGTLVVIDAEMGEAQIETWYAAQGIHADDRLVLISLRGRVSTFNILDRGVRAEWAAWLRELGARYLILDCVRPFMDALGLDEQHEAGRFLTAYDALLLEAGIPEAVAVHHTGHNGERARGDSRFGDWADVVWTLVSETDAPSRFIKASGRDVNIPESALAYNDAFRQLTLTGGGSRQERQVEDALSAIRSELAGTSEPLSGNKLEETLGGRGLGKHSRKAIRDALALGIKTGVITRETGPRRAGLHRLAVPPP